MKRKQRAGGRVYVISDGKLIKIGMSSRGFCKTRFTEVKKEFGFHAKDSFVTDKRYDYALIERMAHEKLDHLRVHHEFFSATFGEGIAAVKDVINELDSVGFGGSVNDLSSNAIAKKEDHIPECEIDNSVFNERRRARSARSNDQNLFLLLV
nr:GIY-YIG nuclease family protein [uncultured Vibrio sp.]